MELPLVSFVIPVRDDAVRLRRCIRAILAGDYPPDRIEIVVADNGSTDGSDRVGDDARVRVLALPGLCVAELRNRAVLASQGSVLAFVDADHEIGSAWLRSAIETLSIADVAAVGAPYVAPPSGTWVQRAYDGLRRHSRGVHPVAWLASGNLAVRRDAFERIGGFDASLEACEDVDLCRRLRADGARLMSDSRLYSIHYGDPSTLRQLFAGELWRGRNNIAVSLRPPVSVRSIVSLLIPVLQLVLLSLLVAGALVGSTLGLELFGIGAAGIIALVLLQASRMLQRRRVTPAVAAQIVVVAGVYGLARAFALIARTPHAARRAGGA